MPRNDLTVRLNHARAVISLEYREIPEWCTTAFNFSDAVPQDLKVAVHAKLSEEVNRTWDLNQ